MAQIPGNPQAMTYDADGNVTNDGIWSYSWDGENRLIRLTTVAAPSTGYPQITLTFRYDYLGRRVEKLVIDNASNRLLTGRRFLYDGWNLIAEYALNPQLSTLSLFRSYTWGLDITRTLTDAGGVGALLQIADHRSGKTYFPAYDGNGNITALVNSSTGAVAAAYEYSPFGEPLRADAPDSVVADQPFRFSTKYTDSETGLVYYGRRYYDPKQGRFLGRDSIEELGGRNLYGFCGNNGVNRWDMLGNLPSEVFALFGDNGFGNGWSNGNAPENFSTTDSAGRYWTLTPQWNEGSVMSYGLSFAEQNRRGGWDTTNVVAFNGDGHFMDASDFAYSANSAMYDPGFDWNTLFPDDPSTTGHLFGAGGLFGPKVPASRVIIGTPIVVAAAGMVTTVPGILPNTTGGVSAVGSWLSRAGAWILTAADTTLLGPLGGILMLTPTAMGNGEIRTTFDQTAFNLPNVLNSQDKRLSDWEIKQLQNAGIDPHDLKPQIQGSRYDLFKDGQGNIIVKPKDGSGPGEATGINIKDLPPKN
jgi:RHS repeat-associated protein